MRLHAGVQRRRDQAFLIRFELEQLALQLGDAALAVGGGDAALDFVQAGRGMLGDRARP